MNGRCLTVSYEKIRANFAENLKILRENEGLTLKQLAEVLDIPFQTLSRYERGSNTPNLVQALKIAYFFNMDLESMALRQY